MSLAAFADFEVQCVSGATTVNLRLSKYMSTIEVKADGFTIVQDGANVTTEANGKLTFLTMEDDGLVATNVLLSKNKQKASLISVENQGSVVKKSLTCVEVKSN